MKKIPYLVFILLAILVVITYHGVFSTFYQQDEWATLGQIFIKGFATLYDVEAGQNIFRLFMAEGRVLSAVMYLILYSIKYFSIVPISVFGLLVHTLNAFFVYILAKKISRNYFIALFASVFFAVSAAGSEAITWAAAIATLPSTTLLLCSLLLYVNFLETKSIRNRNWSFIIGILSLYFKETGLFIFIFYPVLYAVWHKTFNIKEIIRVHVPLILYGGALVGFRIAEIFVAPVVGAGFVSNQSGGFIFSVLYHCTVYPLTSLFQVFVPASSLYGFAPIVVRSEYTYLVGNPLFDMVSQSVVADVVSIVGTTLIGMILGVMIAGKKETVHTKRLVFVGLFLFVLSFLPYAVLHRFFSYLSSRYYYVGVVGASFLFGYAVSWVSKYLSVLLRVLLFVAVGFYLLSQIRVVQQDLRVQIDRANERKTFLKEIKSVHPTLQDRSVFYITSDKKYLGEITYPFQSGLGYILEVWYYNSGKIPRSFIASNFLWDLGEEGYRSTGISGFGYFEHLDKLGELVKEGKIAPGIVYGYVYNSKTHKFSNVTLSVREQLATLSGILK